MLDSIIRTASRLPPARLRGLAEHAVKPIASVAYRRQLVAANLARAFPDAELAPLMEDFYTAFAQVCVEVPWARTMDAAELRERVCFEGAEALNGRQAVLLMAHHGNLVWAATALALHIATPVSVVYKTPHIAAMRQLLTAIAERFGVDAVPVKEVRRHLVKSRQQCRVWTLVADQRPGKDRHYANLCGQRTAFFNGPRAHRPGHALAGVLPLLPTLGSSALSLRDRQDRRTALRVYRGGRGALRREAASGH